MRVVFTVNNKIQIFNHLSSIFIIRFQLNRSIMDITIKEEPKRIDINFVIQHLYINIKLCCWI